MDISESFSGSIFGGGGNWVTIIFLNVWTIEILHPKDLFMSDLGFVGNKG